MAVTCWNKCARILPTPNSLFIKIIKQPAQWSPQLILRLDSWSSLAHWSPGALHSSMSRPPSSNSTKSTAERCHVGHAVDRMSAAQDNNSHNNNNEKSQDDLTIQRARQIFDHAVTSVLPHAMIKRCLQFDNQSDILTVDGKSYLLNHNVHVVGFGKAVLGMARAVDDVIGRHIVGGVVSVPLGITQALTESHRLINNDMLPGPDSKVKVREGAANNLPDEAALNAAMEIKNIAESIGEEDILLVLISGGGSALLPTPHEPLSLGDVMHLSREMARAGANIRQLNYMRKQVEVLKGGGLASLAYPAKVVSLILSDVIGDPLDFIASGPTVPDSSTPEGCLSLISNLGIEAKVPAPVTYFLKQRHSSTNQQQQMQTSGDPKVWSKVQNVIIGSNTLACESAASLSESLGFLPYILSTELDGEARMVGKAFADLALYISSSLKPSSHRTDLDLDCLKTELNGCFNLKSNQLDELASLMTRCKEEKKSIIIIAGGETTVTVRGGGKGGRSQEMAVAAALEFHNGSMQFSSSSSEGTQGEEDELHGNVRPMNLEKDSNPKPRHMSAVFLSGGTDGQDGPTSSAGGVVDVDFVFHCQQSGLDAKRYIDENDSHTLLKAIKDGRYLLDTGLTGTNVMDVYLLLVNNNSNIA